MAAVAPKVSFRARTEADIYAIKANRIAVHHVSDHRVVAVIGIVSPGNKIAPGPIRTFVEKASELLRNGVHLMVIDPFPPTPRSKRDRKADLGRIGYNRFRFADRSAARHGVVHRRRKSGSFH